MQKLIIFGLIALALQSCTPKSDNLQASIRMVQDKPQTDTTIIILPKKQRNCDTKQKYQGSKGGIFHWDTSKGTGKAYKHYQTK